MPLLKADQLILVLDENAFKEMSLSNKFIEQFHTLTAGRWVQGEADAIASWLGSRSTASRSSLRQNVEELDVRTYKVRDQIMACTKVQGVLPSWQEDNDRVARESEHFRWADFAEQQLRE